MWMMVFSILVPGGQWVQIQDSPTGRDYLHMRFESPAGCTDAALLAAGRKTDRSRGNRSIQMRRVRTE